MSETDSTTVIKSEGIFRWTPSEDDFEDATWVPIAQPPIKNRRSVVSVAFPAADFQTVAAAARKHGKGLSTWIREAALRAARR